MPKISVIVPIYNIEDCICECIDSILNQSFNDIEVILVNDGSTDSCPEIVDKYATLDSRIVVIHKENGGLSEARNYGLDIAKGEFIVFVDGDDAIHPEFCERMIGEVDDDIDIVICNLIRFTKLEDVVISNEKNKSFSMSGREACKNLYEVRYALIYVVACAKLFRKKLFDLHRFPLGLIHEDAYLIPKILYESRRVKYLNLQLYYYRFNPNSITNQKFSIKNYDAVISNNEMISYFKKKNDKELLRMAVINKKITIAKHYLNAKQVGIVKKVPKQYQCGMLKAIIILFKYLNYDQFEYILYQFYPKITTFLSYIRCSGSKINKILRG